MNAHYCETENIIVLVLFFFFVNCSLSMRSFNWVRSFIVGSVSLLQTDTTGTVQDSLTSFYDTLCADMNTTAMDETLSVDLGSWFGFEDSPEFEFKDSPDFEIGGICT